MSPASISTRAANSFIASRYRGRGDVDDEGAAGVGALGVGARARQESFDGVVQPVFGEPGALGHRCRGLADYIAGDEDRVDVEGRARGIVGDREGGASDEEELGPRPACLEFFGRVVQQGAGVLPPEARLHARFSAPSVMKTPRRGERGRGLHECLRVEPADVGDEPPGPGFALGEPGPSGSCPSVPAGEVLGHGSEGGDARLSPVLLGVAVHTRAAAWMPA